MPVVRVFGRQVFNMSETVFNLNDQNKDLTSKITVGLQRISEAFKVLLWEKAKLYGLSPIQIQILIFIDNHKSEYNNVSYLAKEFNVTKPTVSDAIKALVNKNLISKDFSSEDSRRYSVFLTEEGRQIVSQTQNFAAPLRLQLDEMKTSELEALFNSISKVIYNLNKAGILTVQRTCRACKFYSETSKSHYCNLLQKPLHDSELRIDCPEFESKD